MSGKEDKEATEQIRQLVSELRMLEGAVKITKSQLDLISASVTELTIATSTLEGLKSAQGHLETLVPIGGGSYVPTTITKVDKTIMGVGAGVCVERGIDEALEELKARKGELDKVRQELQQQLVQAARRMEDVRSTISSMLGEGGAVAVV